MTDRTTVASDLQPEPPPEPPRPPESWECCRSGCDPCVYDLYWEAYARYEAALADWKKRGSCAKSHAKKARNTTT